MTRSLNRRVLLALLPLFLLPTPGQGQAALTADEYRLLPLRIHLLQSPELPDLHCKLKDADIRRIVGKVNGIWKQAGVQFFVESILREEAGAQPLLRGLGENRGLNHLPLARPRASRSDRMFHLYYIHEMGPNGICFGGSGDNIFVKETAGLEPVPGGIDEPLPRVSAHEIGHALRLPHRQDRTNLMASGTTGTSLNAGEIAIAREAAEALPWRLTPSEALAHADRLRAENRAGAAAVYEALVRLPEGPVAAAARRRQLGETAK